MKIDNIHQKLNIDPSMQETDNTRKSVAQWFTQISVKLLFKYLTEFDRCLIYH